MATAVARPANVPGHLAALDGLRGIAVLLVVWYHIWEMTWLPADVPVGPWVANFNVFPETGSAGVDLFFFISGFCLFYPYARTLFDGAPLQSVAVFAYRRILKIAPSYYLTVVALIAIGFAHFANAGEAFKEIASHLTFTHAFWDDTWGGINGSMWSLSIEVQFYVIFPIVCWFAMRWPLPTFGLVIASAIVYRALISHDFAFAHEIDRLPGTIDVFAAGMFTAWAYRAIAVRAPRLANRRRLWLAVALLGAGLAYAALAYQFAHRYDPNWSQGWKATLRPSLDVALVPLTLGSLLTFPAWQRLVGNPPLVFLSFVSYNLYLWHQPIGLLLFDHKVLKYIGDDPHKDHAWGLVFSLVAFSAAVAVALLITICVEQPLLRRKPFSQVFRDVRFRGKVPGNIPEATR